MLLYDISNTTVLTLKFKFEASQVIWRIFFLYNVLEPFEFCGRS